jgi:hypothetical protein
MSDGRRRCRRLPSDTYFEDRARREASEAVPITEHPAVCCCNRLP